MKIRHAENNVYLFWCPGCDQAHSINSLWQYNGDAENPTISPSILVNGTKDITDDECQRIMNGERIKPIPFVCHSYVRDGKIQFLSDCTHDLAGQTVDLPEWEETGANGQ